MTLGFLVGSKNFCKLFYVSWDVFLFWHGYDWIHWVAKSCTTTAYRCLCRDSHTSFRTLWSAVIKSPKFPALGTTVPVRFLQGALVILVFRQMSQFRSFGKWLLILCLPDTTVPRGSEDDSREELAGASPWAGTLSSTRFSVNSCNHSGRWRTGSHRTLSMPLVLSLLVHAGCRVGITASCGKDVGDVGVAEIEEPVYRQGTTIGT